MITITSLPQPEIICNTVDLIEVAEFVTRLVSWQYELTPSAGDNQTIDDIRQEVYIAISKIVGDYPRSYYVTVGKRRAYQYLRWWRCGHHHYDLDAPVLQSTENCFGMARAMKTNEPDNFEVTIRRTYKMILIIRGAAIVNRASRRSALKDATIIHWAARGYSNKEIGALINNNAATVSRRRRRIRAMLTQSLQDRQN